MNMINEQIRELRELTYAVKNEMAGKHETSAALNEAADTIESLSAKLADIERPAEDCRGGWIYCGDGKNLPEEPFACIVTVIDTEPMTMTDFENILPYHVGYDGKQWNNSDGEQIPFDVIAWQPLPEPYHEP